MRTLKPHEMLNVAGGLERDGHGNIVPEAGDATDGGYHGIAADQGPDNYPQNGDPNPGQTAAAAASCLAGIATLAQGNVSPSGVVSTAISCGTVIINGMSSQGNDRFLPAHY